MTRSLTGAVRDNALTGALRLAAKMVTVDHQVESRLTVPPHWGRGAVVVMVVGVDTRSRLKWRYRRIPQGELIGSRADSILVVVVDVPSNVIRVIMVPRSLGVELPDLGYQRLGWAREYGGSSSLVAATRSALGIDIHHYVELDFQAFAALVDSVGGIDFDVPTTMRDWRAGVDLSRGSQRLDGPSALGFVRSRHQMVKLDGRLESQTIGDDGRSRRLADMTDALVTRVSRGMSPKIAARIALTTSRHVSMDPALANSDWAPFISMIRVMGLEHYSLPVAPVVPSSRLRSPFPPFQSSGSNYLKLTEPQARNMLESLAPMSERACNGPTG